MPIRNICWPKIGNFAASACMHQSFIFKKNTETLKIICFFFKFLQISSFYYKNNCKKNCIFLNYFIFFVGPQMSEIVFDLFKRKTNFVS